MKIIIDAYNFIKQITETSYVSQEIINEWIQKFSNYVEKRNNAIILAFDAGPSLYASSEYQGNILVLYSGQEYSADDVIKDWLLKQQGQDILLVTSDREICDFAHQINVVSINSVDFYRIFEHVMQQQDEYEQKVKDSLHKTTYRNIPELDELMETGSRNLVKDQICPDETLNIRVRNGKKASKQDKRLTKKIEKI